ncbi:MAG: GNAT family N-acetyltransferase [Promethearchaeota archaeon]
MNIENRNSYTNSNVSLKKITRRNVEQILNLRVKPGQRFLVAPNAKSIALAHYERGTWMRGIYLGNEPIGFVLLIDSTLKRKRVMSEKSFLYLWRFMIDGRYQGNGYGRRALELVIEYAKSRPNVKEITLHHETGKGNAGEFYKKVGFKHTGKTHENELEMMLTLN